MGRKHVTYKFTSETPDIIPLGHRSKILLFHYCTFNGIKSPLATLTFKDNIIHYHAENLKNLSSVQVICIQNKIERLEVFA